MFVHNTLPALAVAVAAIVLGVEASAAQGPVPPSAKPTPVSSPALKAYMKETVDPAANAVFAAGNDAPAGETPAAAAARYDAAAKGAATLKAVAAKLASPDFAPKGDAGDWAKFSASLMTVATAAETAAKARNAEAAFTAGGDLYDSCNNCHHEYQAGRS